MNSTRWIQLNSPEFNEISPVKKDPNKIRLDKQAGSPGRDDYSTFAKGVDMHGYLEYILLYSRDTAADTIIYWSIFH